MLKGIGVVVGGGKYLEKHATMSQTSCPIYRGANGSGGVVRESAMRMGKDWLVVGGIGEWGRREGSAKGIGGRDDIVRDGRGAEVDVLPRKVLDPWATKKGTT